MKCEEQYRLQGMGPTSIERDVSSPSLRVQIGNAMSPNVVERILGPLLPSAGFKPNASEDRWVSGKAMEQIRESKDKAFSGAHNVGTVEIIPPENSVHEFHWYANTPTYKFYRVPNVGEAPTWENDTRVLHRTGTTAGVLFDEKSDRRT